MRLWTSRLCTHTHTHTRVHIHSTSSRDHPSPYLWKTKIISNFFHCDLVKTMSAKTPQSLLLLIRWQKATPGDCVSTRMKGGGGRWGRRVRFPRILMGRCNVVQSLRPAHIRTSNKGCLCTCLNQRVLLWGVGTTWWIRVPLLAASVGRRGKQYPCSKGFIQQNRRHVSAWKRVLLCLSLPSENGESSPVSPLRLPVCVQPASLLLIWTASKTFKAFKISLLLVVGLFFSPKAYGSIKF